MKLETVSILYRRLPDRAQRFEQYLMEETDGCIVTFIERTELTRPVRVEGRVVLEAGSPIIWFTYPGRWHDLGRFHLPDGTFTGFYANILTPVVISGRSWETTDLFLDIWVGTDGVIQILDEDEFADARDRGWVDEITARRALAEAEKLARAARSGRWPSPHAHGWDLDRAERTLHQLQMSAEPSATP